MRLASEIRLHLDLDDRPAEGVGGRRLDHSKGVSCAPREVDQVREGTPVDFDSRVDGDGIHNNTVLPDLSDKLDLMFASGKHAPVVHGGVNATWRAQTSCEASSVTVIPDPVPIHATQYSRCLDVT